MSRLDQADNVAEEQRAAYDKLLNFIDTTHHYRIDKIFGQLPSDGEACSSEHYSRNSLDPQTFTKPRRFS